MFYKFKEDTHTEQFTKILLHYKCVVTDFNFASTGPKFSIFVESVKWLYPYIKNVLTSLDVCICEYEYACKVLQCSAYSEWPWYEVFHYEAICLAHSELLSDIQREHCHLPAEKTS
jgi:hypothetical protein